MNRLYKEAITNVAIDYMDEQILDHVRESIYYRLKIITI